MPRTLTNKPFAQQMVGRGGVEPPTSRLSGVRSNHLSYRPGAFASRFLQQREALESLPGRYASDTKAYFPVMKGHEDGGNVLWT
jgi:hypothetical protein